MEPQITHRPGEDQLPRILAATALLIGAIVLIVVIAGSMGSGSSGGVGGGAHRIHKPKDKYYVIQPGDTFGAIAHHENVSVATLERLNPNLDTQLLPERGCVNVVSDGCKILETHG